MWAERPPSVRHDARLAFRSWRGMCLGAWCNIMQDKRLQAIEEEKQRLRDAHVKQASAPLRTGGTRSSRITFRPQPGRADRWDRLPRSPINVAKSAFKG